MDYAVVNPLCALLIRNGTCSFEWCEGAAWRHIMRLSRSPHGSRITLTPSRHCHRRDFQKCFAFCYRPLSRSSSLAALPEVRRHRPPMRGDAPTKNASPSAARPAEKIAATIAAPSWWKSRKAKSVNSPQDGSGQRVRAMLRRNPPIWNSG